MENLLSVTLQTNIESFKIPKELEGYLDNNVLKSKFKMPHGNFPYSYHFEWGISQNINIFKAIERIGADLDTSFLLSVSHPKINPTMRQVFYVINGKANWTECISDYWIECEYKYLHFELLSEILKAIELLKGLDNKEFACFSHRTTIEVQTESFSIDVCKHGYHIEVKNLHEKAEKEPWLKTYQYTRSQSSDIEEDDDEWKPSMEWEKELEEEEMPF
jgi:hypothetical protein